MFIPLSQPTATLVMRAQAPAMKNTLYSSEMDPNTPSLPHTDTHTHTVVLHHQRSLAQVRSSGIMGNGSCGPSHLFHLRASQKHPRRLLHCSPPLPRLFLWLFCSPEFTMWAEFYLFTICSQLYWREGGPLNINISAAWENGAVVG